MAELLGAIENNSLSRRVLMVPVPGLGVALLLLVVLLHVDCGSSASNRRKTVRRDAVESLKVKTDEVDPFDEIAQYLIRSSSKSSPIRSYKLPEIRRALQKLAASQSTLKTMDGATHQFRNAFKDSSSLSARCDSFLSSTKRSKKEAAKVNEYVTTVERAMQASEILQAASQQDAALRESWLAAAGLRELQRVPLSHNKVKCVLYILQPTGEVFPTKSSEKKEKIHSKKATSKQRGHFESAAEGDQDDGQGMAGKHSSSASLSPQRISAGAVKRKIDKVTRSQPRRFEQGELILCVVEEGPHCTALAQVLRMMDQKPIVAPLQSVGFVQEDITLQPTIASLAVAALEAAVGYLPPPQRDDGAEPEEKRAQAKTNSSVKAVGVKNGAHASSARNGTPGGNISATQDFPRHIRIVGYSAGGAVGAYMAMVLEGLLNTTASALLPVAPLVGLYKSRVTCLAVAPPPCVSRTVVPKFISSILCGDDVIPRASPESIAHLRDRILKALQSGAGKEGLGGLGWAAGAGWISDLSAVAAKGLGQYASGQHDLTSLSIPGRAFYIKSRQHKGGASIQRVLRGNWREDMLWLLHEILLSKRMLDHHSIDYHIKTLARC